MGFPVDPEVYNINNGSSASITSALQNFSAFSNKGLNKTSLPSTRFILELIRLTTSTVSTISASNKASSTIPFKSIVLFPLYEPSEVITILDSQSLILVESALAEKPAKTTECIAPILAHARTVIANSGIIGK